MKEFINFIAMVIFILFGLFISFKIATNSDISFKKPIPLVVGQVWVEPRTDPKNPFEERKTFTNLILDIKDGYVKERVYAQGESFLFSQKERSFRFRSKMIGTNFVERIISETNYWILSDRTITQIHSKVSLEIKE